MDILKNLKRLGGKKNIWDKKMILKFWDGFLVRYRKTYVLKNDKWIVKRELKEKKKKNWIWVFDKYSNKRDSLLEKQ